MTQNQYGIRTQKTSQLDLGKSVGRWIHVVGTYDKGTGDQKLYIDGELADTQSHPAWNTIVPLKSYSDMMIGHSRVNNGYFMGIIDEVRLYSRALSNNEVDGLYSKATNTNTVTVKWNKNTEVDLAGYRLHYGSSSRNYAFSVDAGNLTSYTLTGLDNNVTHFLAVTAYDNAGNESDYSQELILW